MSQLSKTEKKDIAIGVPVAAIGATAIILGAVFAAPLFPIFAALSGIIMAAGGALVATGLIFSTKHAIIKAHLASSYKTKKEKNIAIQSYNRLLDLGQESLKTSNRENISPGTIDQISKTALSIFYN